MTNRLATETSPYLLQHADNPVDWYPWGEEAFARARAENRPILLSVGYSTCHWCHVMAHESFENPEIARLINEHFVPVKVDREERPDVDAIYMAAVQAISGQGGWPMTVFLTPDLEPFYAGTYYPPEDRFGRPGLPRLLLSLSDAWHNRPDDVQANARQLTEFVRSQVPGPGRAVDLDPNLAERARANLEARFDARWGGFGEAPKFPPPTTLDFLMSHHRRTGSGLEMVTRTLEGMMQGGLYDHLGGGFARYSTDAEWRVPHFEKMLYDNAQLVRSYLHAYQLSGRADFLRVVRDTLAYLEREMRSPEGGFYSAQDADSEGIEGKFYVWTPQELRAALGEDAPLAEAYFGVSEAGNFSDPHHPEFGRRSVLTAERSLNEVAARLGTDVEQAAARLEVARRKLWEARERRVRPGRDDKVLTSWNGLALAAFAEAARVLRDPHYLEVARAAARFARQHLRTPTGGLYHTYKDGRAHVEGLLEDLVLYGLGLVELYRAGGDLADLIWARELWQQALQDHWDEVSGSFYSTRADSGLLARPHSSFDAAILSDNAAAALLGLWISRYFGDADAEERARRVVGSQMGQMLSAAVGFGGLWQAFEFLLAPRAEVAVLGSPERREALEAALGRRYLPFVAIAPAEHGGGLPLLEERSGDGVAYVCRDLACDLPARDVPTLEAQLEAL
ncbi:hypothetical protein HNR42_000356 [Deinobacterium chartae]|uniref:Spermatogenesis-associated protein 20-like TRX domain-containing protein n=1 Tax=Deinobacterium chartae TaxID=521158 RepID=A0A841HWB3_9DEIO|nr:thioredoxin domain-containing protein [Deinobacterium chartae]MBB6096944.1 hypothetical protein [Deinobacterium chartae]